MAADKLYEITSVIKRAKFSPAGVQGDVYEIHFTTASGVRDMIEVPPAEYTPDKVKAKLQQMAEMHEKLFT